MGSWVLILWMSASVNANLRDVSPIEIGFGTQAACKSAFAEIVKVNERTHYVRGVCAER